MIEPVKPSGQNSWEINTKSNFRSPGIEAIPLAENPSNAADLSDVIQSLSGSSSGTSSIVGGGTVVTGITDQEFFNAITATFSPGTGTYGAVVGTGSTGQTIDVTVTLPDINGIIDYKINVVQV